MMQAEQEFLICHFVAAMAAFATGMAAAPSRMDE
jgi:hypothetical protein